MLLCLFLKTVIWYKNTTTDTSRMQSANYYTGRVVTLDRVADGIPVLSTM